MQSLGWFNRGLVRVLDAPSRQTRIATLVSSFKTMEEKYYNMALKTNTQTHQTKDVTAPHSTTHDFHFSRWLQIVWRNISALHFLFFFFFFTFVELSSRDHFSCVTPMKDNSFFLHSTHFLGPDLSPTPCLACYLHNFFYQILHNLLHWWNHLQLKCVIYHKKSAAQ